MKTYDKNAQNQNLQYYHNRVSMNNDRVLDWHLQNHNNVSTNNDHVLTTRHGILEFIFCSPEIYL